MEEVWKNITLNSLYQVRPMTPVDCYRHHHPTSSPSLRGMILQDFPAGPLNRPLTISPPAVEELPVPHPPAPPALPQTVISLNSGLEFQHHVADANSRSNASNSNGQYSSAVSPTGLFSCCSNRKMLRESLAIGIDLKHKRMIKNRESAARSRARKQAYTIQLELEVAHLKEENAKLKKQNEELQLRLAMATQLPKRNTLQRSSTPPF
ncbi:bZIP transcription factor [Musa troglodytarum]|uniref:BZIP transcription factor n=1 Tax=Musa troglodytarum TaxID=320322 RepID=A0A9E7FRY8_9LILI|nr:bZIP transcription factor [Musa troglodytarum]